MKQQWIALLSGILFGLGLGLSQMIDQQRVLGFLDVTGAWDPTLLFVLGGAVTVTGIAFRFILRRDRPVFSPRFILPIRKDIDLPLILGAAIFGVGWGIAGYCPGPGIVALILFHWQPVVFLIALIAGMLLFQFYSTLSSPRNTKMKPDPSSSQDI